MADTRDDRETGLEVAIVGMHCRLPRADSVNSFWTQLKRGFNGITRLSPEQMSRAGVSRDVYEAAHYVPCCGILHDIHLFDHGFFGITAEDAALMDPQHRLLLESCFRALENAGYAGKQSERIGVFAGTSANTYLLNAVLPGHRRDLENGGSLPLLLASDKDFAALRVAYHLGLTGPALTVQSACSTGLSVVHAACRALQAGDCDIAIAAAACVRVPHEVGYLHQEGSIFSRRGICSAFDADADGCVPGNGVVSVVLRRLPDAVEARDTISAVILGSALNSDADDKQSFAAPSAAAQSRVIRDAHLYADVTADDVGYVEAHGTATQLGDPIEAEALIDAFQGSRPEHCGLGSVKTNIGHLDAAAGLAGLVKGALAVSHAKLPPSIHFKKLNAHIRLDKSPLFIVDELMGWRTKEPRIAGVSSFGVGGTNAHVVLMQPPVAWSRPAFTGASALAISASRPELLSETALSLAAELRARPSLDLRDAAFTLFKGRRHLANRAVIVAQTPVEAAVRLEAFASDEATGEADQANVSLRDAAQRWIERQPQPHLDSIVLEREARRIPLTGTSISPSSHWIGPLSNPSVVVPEAAGQSTALTAIHPQTWTWVLRPYTSPPATNPRASWIFVHAGQRLARDLALRLKVDRELMEVRVDTDGPALEQLIAPSLTSGQFLRIVVACFPEREFDAGPSSVLFETGRRVAWDLPFSLAAALARSKQRVHVHLDILTSGRFDILGTESVEFTQWLVHGIEKVLPQECSGVTVRSLDIDGDCLKTLCDELTTTRAATLAIRGEKLWTRELIDISSMEPPDVPEGQFSLRGPVVVLGGFGGIGRILTQQIANKNPGIAIVLVCREASRTVRRIPWQEVRAELNSLFTAFLAERPVRLIQDSPETVGLLHRFCAARIATYWERLGLTCVAGTAFTRGQLTAASNVLAKFERMLDFQIAYLAESGFLEIRGEQLLWLKDRPSSQEAEQAAAEIHKLEPDLTSVVKLLDICVDSYPRALSGEQEPISVLYPQGSERQIGAAAEVMIKRSFGEAACRALGAWIKLAARGSRERPFRVLEVGAGNGLLTREIAAEIRNLLDDDIEFIVTDISRNLVEAAKAVAEKQGWRRVEFGVLDISADPVGQGYDPGSFDLVCGLNVVHATPNATATLRKLRSLLAPDGIMAVIESVRREPWVDMVSGLAADWWGYTDERQVSPLFTMEEWRRLFIRANLCSVEAIFGPSGEEARADCALIVGIVEDQLASVCEGSPHRNLPEDYQHQIHSLRKSGALVEVVFADLRDSKSVRTALSRASSSVGPFGSLVHCAGRIAGGLIRNLSKWEIETEFGARIRGVLHALDAMQDCPPRDVILSSSLNVLTGGTGQAAYVAANATLSGIGESLRRCGVRAMTVHWDRWSGVGLGRTFEARFHKLTGSEVRGGISSEQALQAMQQMWSSGCHDVIIAGGSDTTLSALHSPSFYERSRTGALATLAAPSSLASSSPDAKLADFIARLAGLPPLSPRDRLIDAGMDSLAALDLQAKLQSTFHVTVFSAALLSEPIDRIVDAIRRPAAHSSTVEVTDPAAAQNALEKYLGSTL